MKFTRLNDAVSRGHNLMSGCPQVAFDDEMLTLDTAKETV